jgi:hypothetical protein
VAVNVGEVSVEMLLDFQKSEQQAKDFEAQIANTMASVSVLGPEHYREFAKKAAAELQKVEKEAKKTAEAAAKAFDGKVKQGFAELPGILGDVSDAVRMLGASFLGLSKDQAQAIEGTLELAEKGGQLGSAFGPAGIAIGVTAGILGGIFSANAAQAAKELKAFKDQLKESKDAVKLLRESTSDLATLDLPLAIKALKELDETRNAIIAKTNKGGRNIFGFADDSAMTSLARLRQGIVGVAEAQGKFDAIASASFESMDIRTAEVGGNLGDILGHLSSLGKEKSTKELKADFEAAKTEAEEVQKRVEAFQKKLAERQFLSASWLKEVAKDFGIISKDADEAGKKLTAADAAYSGSRKKRADDAKQKAEEEAKTRDKAFADEQAQEQRKFHFMLEMENRLEEERTAILDRGIAMRLAREQAATQTWISIEQKRLDFLASEKIQEKIHYDEWVKQFNEAFEKNQKVLEPFATVTGQIFSQIEDNLNNGANAFANIGKAARLGVAQVLKAQSKEWGLRALAEVAAGLATSALAPPGTPSRVERFTAAAQFGAAAVAAGGAGLALGKSGGGAGGGGGSSGGSGGSSPSLGKAANSGPTGPQTPSIINISVQTLAPGDQDTWEQIGAAAARGLEAHSRAGGKVRFS